MSGRQSAATEQALKLIEKGMAPFAAAKKVGIDPSTIYRALARRKVTRAEMQEFADKVAPKRRTPALLKKSYLKQ